MVKKLICASKEGEFPDRRLMPLPAHSTSADHPVVPCDAQFPYPRSPLDSAMGTGAGSACPGDSTLGRECQYATRCQFGAFADKALRSWAQGRDLHHSNRTRAGGYFLQASSEKILSRLSTAAAKRHCRVWPRVSRGPQVHPVNSLKGEVWCSPHPPCALQERNLRNGSATTRSCSSHRSRHSGKAGRCDGLVRDRG